MYIYIYMHTFPDALAKGYPLIFYRGCWSAACLITMPCRSQTAAAEAAGGGWFRAARCNLSRVEPVKFYSLSIGDSSPEGPRAGSWMAAQQ